MCRASVFVVCMVVFVAACSSTRTREGTEPSQPETPPAEATPQPRTVQGFRIQILTTSEKRAADTEATNASAWWRGLPAAQRPAGLGRGDLSVDVKWRQPYYRVRMGDFASRAEAQRALSLVKQTYPDAFIVPDTVTIWR